MELIAHTVPSESQRGSPLSPDKAITWNCPSRRGGVGCGHPAFSFLDISVFPAFLLMAGKALLLPRTAVPSSKPGPFQDVGPGSPGSMDKPESMGLSCWHTTTCTEKRRISSETEPCTSRV